MATRTTLVALASAAVIGGIAGCGTSSTPVATTSASPTATTSASAASPSAPACADIGGTVVQPDHICRVDSETSHYKLDFEVPFDYPDRPALTDYVKERRDGFIEWVASLQGKSAYALHIIGDSYQSGTPESGTRSVVLTIGTDGGVHPVTSYKAFNYDLNKKTPITFDTLFKPGSEPLAVLNPIVQRAFAKRGESPVPTSELDAGVYQNFAITDNGVTFFFNQGGPLPHESGPVSVEVPRADIESLLA
jgi:hypothetical protein